MVTKEELEKSTFIGRNSNVWFMTAWALMMFIIDGVVYAVDPPPGESKWGYGPTVFLLCLVRGARRTNDASRAKRDRERRAKGNTNGDSRDATTKATGGANRNANANATPRARSSEVYEETTRGATGDDEGRIGRIGRIVRDD